MLALAIGGLLSNGMPAFAQQTHAGWQVPLSKHEMFIGRGTKGDEVFSIRNLTTGRERPAAELNKWYIHWNHDHLAFSPDGRWALWRDPQDGLVVTSLHGEMERLAWEDHGILYDPLLWQPDSRHFREVEDATHSNGKRPRNYAETFDRRAPGRRVGNPLAEAEAKRLEDLEEPASGTK